MELTEIGKAIGRLEGAVAIHGQQLTELFENTKEIRTYMDQNVVRAEHRDEALDQVHLQLVDIKRIVSNGLAEEVSKCKVAISSMMECIERRKREREEKEASGWGADLKGALQRIRSNAFYLGIILLLWLFFWGLTKIRIFHEGPEVLLKLFGAGQ